jgi:hypothetical protein
MSQYVTSDTFDVAPGMTVYGPDRQPLGIVTEVSGFGSTHVAQATEAPSSERQTEASSGTGFFKVDQTSVSGHGTPELVLPLVERPSVSPQVTRIDHSRCPASGCLLLDITGPCLSPGMPHALSISWEVKHDRCLSGNLGTSRSRQAPTLEPTSSLDHLVHRARSGGHNRPCSASQFDITTSAPPLAAETIPGYESEWRVNEPFYGTMREGKLISG